MLLAAGSTVASSAEMDVGPLSGCALADSHPARRFSQVNTQSTALWRRAVLTRVLKVPERETLEPPDCSLASHKQRETK